MAVLLHRHDEEELEVPGGLQPPSREVRPLLTEVRQIHTAHMKLQASHRPHLDRCHTLDWAGLRAKVAGTSVEKLVSQAASALGELAMAHGAAVRLWEKFTKDTALQYAPGDLRTAVEVYREHVAGLGILFEHLRRAVLELHTGLETDGRQR